jgi:hypothetical protein
MQQGSNLHAKPSKICDMLSQKLDMVLLQGESDPDCCSAMHCSSVVAGVHVAATVQETWEEKGC